MSDMVNHPPHYSALFETKDIECIAVTRQLDFDLGNAFKYLHRLYRKGDKAKAWEDFKKANWYLEDWISNHVPTEPIEISLSFDGLPHPKKDPAELGYFNENAAKAKIAFDFIKPPDSNKDKELYVRYVMLKMLVATYIVPKMVRYMMSMYALEYFKDFVDKEKPKDE